MGERTRKLERREIRIEKDEKERGEMVFRDREKKETREGDKKVNKHTHYH